MRKLTAVEAAEFDGCADHRNIANERYCCPYCFENVSVYDCDGLYDDPDVVVCQLCRRSFIAWTVDVPVACSAKLPDIPTA
jgi:hypothetical protein